MAGSEVKPIRISTADGRLARSGAEWSEPRNGQMKWQTGTGLTLIPVGLGMFLFEGTLAMLILGSAVALIAMAAFSTWRPRSLVFTHDGKVLAPQGLPWRESDTSVPGMHSSIASIEVRGRTYRDPNPNFASEREARNVALISHAGETVYVARDLSEEQARYVATQLTIALNALRDLPPDDGIQGRFGPDDDLIN